MCTVAKNARIYKNNRYTQKNYNTTKEGNKSFCNSYNNIASTNKTNVLTPYKVFEQIFFYYKEIKFL